MFSRISNFLNVLQTIPHANPLLPTQLRKFIHAISSHRISLPFRSSITLTIFAIIKLRVATANLSLVVYRLTISYILYSILDKIRYTHWIAAVSNTFTHPTHYQFINSSILAVKNTKSFPNHLNMQYENAIVSNSASHSIRVLHAVDPACSDFSFSVCEYASLTFANYFFRADVLFYTVLFLSFVSCARHLDL